MTSQAIVPVLLSRSQRQVFANILALVGGVLLLSVLAQITVRLPFTPVPITGQTLGVSLVGLAWGARRGLAIMGLYLLLGAFGFPVFANGAMGLTFGPTLGYLIGMIFAAGIEGYASDRGWTRGFWSALGFAYLGSVMIFAWGLLVLSFFIPAEQLLWAGLYPFLAGDFIKNFLAATLRKSAERLIE